MKALTDEVKQFLEENVPARERANKDKALVMLLVRRQPMFRQAIDADIISMNMLLTMVQDYTSMDRAWRKLLQDNEYLRGGDYQSKDELEIDVQRELGYNVPPTRP